MLVPRSKSTQSLGQAAIPRMSNTAHPPQSSLNWKASKHPPPPQHQTRQSARSLARCCWNILVCFLGGLVSADQDDQEPLSGRSDQKRSSLPVGCILVPLSPVVDKLFKFVFGLLQELKSHQHVTFTDSKTLPVRIPTEEDRAFKMRRSSLKSASNVSNSTGFNINPIAEDESVSVRENYTTSLKDIYEQFNVATPNNSLLTENTLRKHDANSRLNQNEGSLSDSSLSRFKNGQELNLYQSAWNARTAEGLKTLGLKKEFRNLAPLFPSLPRTLTDLQTSEHRT